ncbi:MAG TPA: hypothetical protein VGL23_18390 [Chloroflexota bacterium]|jgi:hypothetical protein
MTIPSPDDHAAAGRTRSGPVTEENVYDDGAVVRLRAAETFENRR